MSILILPSEIFCMMQEIANITGVLFTCKELSGLLNPETVLSKNRLSRVILGSVLHSVGDEHTRLITNCDGKYMNISFEHYKLGKLCFQSKDSKDGECFEERSHGQFLIQAKDGRLYIYLKQYSHLLEIYA